MASTKRTLTATKEWAKHLRPFGKNQFWSSVRNLFRSEEKEEMIQEIDPEELKRNKEDYERELRASLNAEPDTRLPYIVATRIDDGVRETFRNIREEMGEPGPMSFDDHDQRMVNANKLCENGVQPLIPIEKPQLPIAVTHPIYLSKEDQIKANAETVDVFFPDKEDKPLPKVVTIEVTGLPGVGKTVLLQMIDDAIQAKFDIVPLCAELEDEGRQINVNEISQQLIDDYRSGKIIIEMRERTIKPKAFSHECPC